MKHLLFFLTTAITFSLASNAQVASVSAADIDVITGNWTGSLSYLDYTSKRQETIKAALFVDKKSKDHFLFNFSYPNEPNYSSSSDYRLKGKGTKINDMIVLERSVEADGSVKIILEEKGKDGNDHKPATFHHVLQMGNNKLTITKMVKFDGEREYFERNHFAFSR